MALEQTAAPAVLLTTAEAKAHLRVDLSDDDTLIDTLVAAATRHAEQFARRAFVSQTWKLYLDAFPASSADPIYVPQPPLASVSSITYVDTDGVTQTWAASKYTIDAKSAPGRVFPAWGEIYPSTRAVANAVTVEFVAGYGAASAVPQAIKQAVLLLVAHWYEHRESVVIGVAPASVPMTFEMILWPYRAWVP